MDLPMVAFAEQESIADRLTIMNADRFAITNGDRCLFTVCPDIFWP
jgi:hypothetical protein